MARCYLRRLPVMLKSCTFLVVQSPVTGAMAKSRYDRCDEVITQWVRFHRFCQLPLFCLMYEVRGGLLDWGSRRPIYGWAMGRRGSEMVM